jgi:hypothetical protein
MFDIRVSIVFRLSCVMMSGIRIKKFLVGTEFKGRKAELTDNFFAWLMTNTSQLEVSMLASVAEPETFDIDSVSESGIVLG